MMSLPFCHMHGPEHHTLVGSALLTAYRNAGGEIELLKALKEMMARGQKVPGGACGFWGSWWGCHQYRYVHVHPLRCYPTHSESLGQSNPMTARSLLKIGEVGGPRCCKRNSYLSLPGGCRIYQRNKGCHTGNETHCLPPLRRKQPVYRKALSFSSLTYHPSIMKILILCTGNRCRSQMAHGILQQLEPSFKVHSAGVRPASEVHPLTVQ